MDEVAIVAGLTHVVYVDNPGESTILSTVFVTNAGDGEYFVNFLVPGTEDVGVYRVFWVATHGVLVGIEKLPFWVDDP